MVDDRVRDALDMKKLDLPATLPIVAIEVEDFADWQGNDALRVWVILSDDVKDEQLTGEAAIQTKFAIHDNLLARGVQLFPYVTFATETERTEYMKEKAGA